MYSIYLYCQSEQAEALIADLWEFGTVGIRETDWGLIAAFETNEQKADLLRRFASFEPDWRSEDTTDWVAYTHEAWPARAVGQKLFLAPHWSQEETPAGRVRIVHNPGLACGTGEHPCTQLALCAIEKHVRPDDIVVDVGAGSGVLAIAALRLGARIAVASDIDEAALATARENFELNACAALLVAGSADCFRANVADITVANISATVILSLLDDLILISRRVLILTGFPEWEADRLLAAFPGAEVTAIDEWSCLTVHTGSEESAVNRDALSGDERRGIGR